MLAGDRPDPVEERVSERWTSVESLVRGRSDARCRASLTGTRWRSTRPAILAVGRAVIWRVAVRPFQRSRICVVGASEERVVDGGAARREVQEGRARAMGLAREWRSGHSGCSDRPRRLLTVSLSMLRSSARRGCMPYRRRSESVRSRAAAAARRTPDHCEPLCQRSNGLRPSSTPAPCVT